VSTVSRLDLSTFPDSPYAMELQRRSTLRFARPLEREYSQSRLADSRTLIRVASTVSVIMTLGRGSERFLAHSVDLWSLIQMLTVLVSALALASMAWGPSFARLYPKWSPVLVPLKNSLIALQIAGATARGQPEMLMALPIVLIGSFFFLGLPFRASLLCCGTTILTYVVASIHFDVPQATALHSYYLLVGGAIACVIAVWHLEKVARKSFLEGELIRELAQRDPLTGTRNRRMFDEHLELTWQQAVAQQRGMAIVLIDIDHFKAYNDYYGHQAGDQTLRQVAQTVQKIIRRPSDLLARYGGEEFAAVLYEVDATHAREIAERIRSAVSDLSIEHRTSRTANRVTISIGVAVVEPTTDRSPSGAVQLADQALYEAKVQGRNRIALMDHDQHDLLTTGVFAVGSLRSVNEAVTTLTTRSVRNGR
jgi:diguanylate cyclase (GGDEF)-like protein